ncbi:hypothetical protein M0G43_09240 [Subsaxibacter sp. CAU 1640]|uniref:hypothetical protein n=1 Tax=Subsaxibacter sp. CAU 1640 TaxID=2933271 RepID=UPI00200302EB|nr:hypothetical protein [Subsaxibacter sp. CAU 1640]MCK7590757.1 hypothetical protein [Subsaxibacter sp. CAU 1640]
MRINLFTCLILLVSLNSFSQKEKYTSDLDTLYLKNGEKRVAYISITSGKDYIDKIKLCKKRKKDMFGREVGNGDCVKYNPEQLDPDRLVYGFSAARKKDAAKQEYELTPKVRVFFKVTTKSKETKFKDYTLLREGDNYDFYHDMVSYSYMSGNNWKTKIKNYTCLTNKGERHILKCFRSDNYKFYDKEIVEYFSECESELKNVLKDMKLRDPFPYEVVDDCTH